MPKASFGVYMNWKKVPVPDDWVNDPENKAATTPIDSGLITFDDEGRILISHQLAANDRKLLGIKPSLRLRFFDPRHLPYLQYHRTHVFKKEGYARAITSKRWRKIC